jgi:hypothetical protein
VLRNTLALQSDARLLEHAREQLLKACPEAQTRKIFAAGSRQIFELRGRFAAPRAHARPQLSSCLDQRNIGYEAIERCAEGDP